MKNVFIIAAVLTYALATLVVGIMTVKGAGVSTPKIVKTSVRAGSARTHRLHGGYLYGK